MKAFYVDKFFFACLVIFFITFCMDLGYFWMWKGKFWQHWCHIQKEKMYKHSFEVTFETAAKTQGLDAVIKDDPKNAL